MTLAIKLRSFGSPEGLPSPHFENVNVILTLFQKWGCNSMAHTTPKNFTYLVNTNFFYLYNFLNIVSKGPYFLSNMHLICVSICRHNIKQQHIFEGQVLKVSSSGYLNINIFSWHLILHNYFQLPFQVLHIVVYSLSHPNVK